MLHGIKGDCAIPPGQSTEDAFYDVSEIQFSAVLELVACHGLDTVVSGEIDDRESTRKVVISFDDGRVSDFAVAMPALLDRNMRGVFFVTADWIGTRGFLSAPQLREMVSLNMDVQAHGKSHRFLADLQQDELVSELAGAKAGIEDIVGRSVTALAYPGGRGDRRVRETALELGYRSFFCSRPGWYSQGMPEVPRLVVHGSSVLRDVDQYLQRKTGPVVRQVARYYAGRTLRRVLGGRGYALLKSAVRGY